MTLLRGTKRTITPPKDSATIDEKMQWIRATLKSFYIANGGRASGPFNPADEIFSSNKTPKELIASLEERANEKLKSRTGFLSLFFGSGEPSATEKTVADMGCCQYYDAKDGQHYKFNIHNYAERVQQEKESKQPTQKVKPSNL